LKPAKLVSFYLLTIVIDTWFKATKPSLHVNILEDNTFIQVIPTGILHIDRDKKPRHYDVKARVLCAVSNHRQVILALEDRALIYFELEDDKLTMYERKTIDVDVNSILNLD
jgi:hypothetical protein